MSANYNNIENSSQVKSSTPVRANTGLPRNVSKKFATFSLMRKSLFSVNVCILMQTDLGGTRGPELFLNKVLVFKLMRIENN